MRKQLSIGPACLLTACMALNSCNFGNQVGDASLTAITKNACGLLVFQDSTHFQTAYDYLEQQLDAYENSTASQTSQDEEKPLTDFEQSKNHLSYRQTIINQEQTAEDNDVDLSVNPVYEILEDEEILQSFLNKDRMFIIDSTVYYYYDDCTLYKFPIGKECAKTIADAISYFEQLQHGSPGKPGFYYQQTDICEDEEDFKSITDGYCQDISVLVCTPNPCQPQFTTLFIYFPNIKQSMFHLNKCEYEIGGTTKTLNIALASDITNSGNGCGYAIGSYGFVENYNFSATGKKYKINVTAEFTYLDENNATQICTTKFTYEWLVQPPCPINETVTVNGFIVTIDAVNPCTSQSGGFTFTHTDGSPSVLSGYPTPTSTQLEYNCQGKKSVTINYSLNGCQNSKTINVYPVNPGLCCKKQRGTCNGTIPSTGIANHKVSVKLKQRNWQLVAIVRNFEKNSKNKWKRRKTNFSGGISGSVYYYLNSCDCKGVFDFKDVSISAAKSKKKKKVRVKYKFRSE
ncbi:hypothetical protein KC799_27635, partial [candidate division KSB1 bacterium]|nr:hypothetical protein [candidate division KSB1 bacterium]